MDIRIEVISKKAKKINNVKAFEGRIYIGDFNEYIYIPLDLWTIEDYKKQWKDGLERIKNHNTSCLIATIHDPNIRKFVNWWTLYKEDNVIYVHNGLIMEDHYDKLIGNKEFNALSCYDFISPRKTHTEDGTEVSEWSVPSSE